MAVKIRLRRMGTNKTPFYRVVVADSRTARNGRFLESLGTYDPRKPSAPIAVDPEKTLRWLQQGAQPTDTVRELLRHAGIMRQLAERKAKPAATA
jgi:small subunit ribosomal protein S16